MNLENAQALNHQAVSLSRNLSGSNDPQQIKHDMNEQLFRGARLIGEGRQQGLNDDQILDLAVQRIRQNDAFDPNISQRREAQTRGTNIADMGIANEIMRRQAR